MVHNAERVGLDGLRVEFDDERAVSRRGDAVSRTLAGRLGIETRVGRMVKLRPDRPGAANTGRKVMALLFTLVLGADSINDCEILRPGRAPVAGWLDPGALDARHLLRAFTFGHVRQVDVLHGRHSYARGRAVPVRATSGW